MARTPSRNMGNSVWAVYAIIGLRYPESLAPSRDQFRVTGRWITNQASVQTLHTLTKHASNHTTIATPNQTAIPHNTNPIHHWHIHIIFYDVSVIIYHSTPQIEYAVFSQPNPQPNTIPALLYHHQYIFSYQLPAIRFHSRNSDNTIQHASQFRNTHPRCKTMRTHACRVLNESITNHDKTKHTLAVTMGLAGELKGRNGCPKQNERKGKKGEQHSGFPAGPPR
jgi:hypothetical protein